MNYQALLFRFRRRIFLLQVLLLDANLLYNPNKIFVSVKAAHGDSNGIGSLDAVASILPSCTPSHDLPSGCSSSFSSHFSLLSNVDGGIDEDEALEEYDEEDENPELDFVWTSEWDRNYHQPIRHYDGEDHDGKQFARRLASLRRGIGSGGYDRKIQSRIRTLESSSPWCTPRLLLPLRSVSSRTLPSSSTELPSSAWSSTSSSSTRKYGKILKTGTTIAGIVVKLNPATNGTSSSFGGESDGGSRAVVVLGADTRATAENLVADKNASKIHQLASNLYCCGAGTSADLLHLTRWARYTFVLQQPVVGNDPVTFPLQDGSLVSNDFENVASTSTTTTVSNLQHNSVDIRVATRLLQNALFDQAGSCQAHLILGGVDPRSGEPFLRAIHPHGSVDALPYAALGSGGWAAMAVLESRYQSHYQGAEGLKEAVQLVTDAIRAGIENDLGSGSAIDLCIIDSNGCATHIRSAVREEGLPNHPFPLPPTLAKINNSCSTTSPLEGVNGFGNQPFAIRSKSIIQKYKDSTGTQDEWIKWWNQ